MWTYEGYFTRQQKIYIKFEETIREILFIEIKQKIHLMRKQYFLPQNIEKGLEDSMQEMKSIAKIYCK